MHKAFWTCFFEFVLQILKKMNNDKYKFDVNKLLHRNYNLRNLMKFLWLKKGGKYVLNFIVISWKYLMKMNKNLNWNIKNYYEKWILNFKDQNGNVNYVRIFK